MSNSEPEMRTQPMRPLPPVPREARLERPIAQAMRRAGEEVDHPAHYGGAENPYEAIKIIEAHNLNFNKGNSLKYLLRAGKKPGVDEVKDLEKAVWYLQREIGLVLARRGKQPGDQS